MVCSQDGMNHSGTRLPARNEETIRYTMKVPVISRVQKASMPTTAPSRDVTAQPISKASTYCTAASAETGGRARPIISDKGTTTNAKGSAARVEPAWPITTCCRNPIGRSRSIPTVPSRTRWDRSYRTDGVISHAWTVTMLE
jgi:hypothetical protein